MERQRACVMAMLKTTRNGKDSSIRAEGCPITRKSCAITVQDCSTTIGKLLNHDDGPRGCEGGLPNQEWRASTSWGGLRKITTEYHDGPFLNFLDIFKHRLRKKLDMD